jgi:hypothetical protein
MSRDDDDARPAPWVRTMPPDAQVIVTDAALELARVKERHPVTFHDLDAHALLGASGPREAKQIAENFAARYDDTPGDDGQRVRGLCAEIAETIGRHFGE